MKILKAVHGTTPQIKKWFNNVHVNDILTVLLDSSENLHLIKLPSYFGNQKFAIVNELWGAEKATIEDAFEGSAQEILSALELFRDQILNWKTVFNRVQQIPCGAFDTLKIQMKSGELKILFVSIV